MNREEWVEGIIFQRTEQIKSDKSGKVNFIQENGTERYFEAAGPVNDAMDIINFSISSTGIPLPDEYCKQNGIANVSLAEEVKTDSKNRGFRVMKTYQNIEQINLVEYLYSRREDVCSGNGMPLMIRVAGTHCQPNIFRLKDVMYIVDSSVTKDGNDYNYDTIELSDIEQFISSQMHIPSGLRPQTIEKIQEAGSQIQEGR